MDITVADAGENRIKVQAVVPAAEVDKQVAKVYGDAARKYNFPGFRKGKAPRPVIDNALGRETVMASATEDVINAAYPKIIEEKLIYPVASPDFGDAGLVEPGKDFSFEFELNVKPEFELSSYEPVEVDLPVSKASEADIDDQVEGFMKHYNVEEATDEWARDTMGFEDLADMREQIAQTVEARKAQVMPRIKENVCGLALIERLEEDAPEGMAEAAESELLQDFFTQLQRQGVSFDAYLSDQGITSDQFKEDIKRQAADEAKKKLALDAWARHFGIEAADEDMDAEFAAAGMPDPQKAKQEWADQGRLYMIREGITRYKAMENLMETAKVTEIDYAKQDREAAAKEKAEGAAGDEKAEE